MSRTALILAAHGSDADPDANARLCEFAARIARRGLFDEVATAFHRGEPKFSTILDQLDANEVTVVPVMTSDGYYNDVVLPRELAKNRRYAQLRLQQTAPLGTHPGIVSLVMQRVLTLTREHNLAVEDTCVALVGHGTPRHPRSRLATNQLAEAFQEMEPFCEVLCAFLDEPPGVESIVGRTTKAAIIVFPFLISGGPHATVDIPSRLGLQTTQGATPPFHSCVGDRFVVCDAAIGTHPEIVDIIVALATSAWHGQASAWPRLCSPESAPARRQHAAPVEASL